ncbi:hypothetical protein K469DRAFT_575648, partial [Zopfia rhizophila CBS 207.26]
LWYFASGTCLPSAGDDGNGGITHSVDVPVIGCVAKDWNKGCPVEPQWNGPNTEYNNVPREPFPTVPTYYRTQYCQQDDSWRIYYGLYFKKDTSHKSDWEDAIVKFVRTEDRSKWRRYGLAMEVHGNRGIGYWQDIPNTFDGDGDLKQSGNKDRNYPKLFIGKFAHTVNYDPEGQNKGGSCIGEDFKTDDFYLWSLKHLRSANAIDRSWNYGQATNPHNVDLCGPEF